MAKAKRFAECIDCWIWGEIPDEVKANKHLVICPQCGKSMFWGPNPLEAGQRVENQRTLDKWIDIPKDMLLPGE